MSKIKITQEIMDKYGDNIAIIGKDDKGHVGSNLGLQGQDAKDFFNMLREANGLSPWFTDEDQEEEENQ